MFTIVSSNFEQNTIFSTRNVKHFPPLLTSSGEAQPKYGASKHKTLAAVVGMFLLKDDVSTELPNRWKPNQSSDYWNRKVTFYAHSVQKTLSTWSLFK